MKTITTIALIVITLVISGCSVQPEPTTSQPSAEFRKHVRPTLASQADAGDILACGAYAAVNSARLLLPEEAKDITAQQAREEYPTLIFKYGPIQITKFLEKRGLVVTPHDFLGYEEFKTGDILRVKIAMIQHYINIVKELPNGKYLTYDGFLPKGERYVVFGKDLHKRSTGYGYKVRRPTKK